MPFLHRKGGEYMKNTHNIISVSIFVAIISVCSCITIPVSIIPITMSLFGIFLCSVLLGGKLSFYTSIIYILVGIAGIPVFSGFRGGIGTILSPVGGYILAYPFAALILGIISEKSKYNFASLLSGSFIALLIIYLFGTVYFAIVTKNTIRNSVKISVYPFVFFDLIKCILAITIGKRVKKILEKL